MVDPEVNNVRRYLQALTAGDSAELADGALLERFITFHDDAAFTTLVRRYGPMVLSVCRRTLHDAQQAEDAFQATFLVLARRAASIGKCESLAAFLHGVALRTALKARGALARRRNHERRAAVRSPNGADREVSQEWLVVLDEEVQGLPERYRIPVVLCYLQGRTYEEAAQDLGWPKGTLSTRLARAREILRGRLVRRGVALPAGAFAAVLSQAGASAAVPFALVEITLLAAASYSAGKVAGMMATPAVTIAEGVLRAMFLTRLKVAVLLLLALGVAGAGTAGLAQRLSSDGKPAAAEQPSTARFEDRVKEFVGQLGAEEYQRREAAHRALVKLGPAILPIVDNLGVQNDVEIRKRLARIRRELVGDLEDIRAGLEAMPEIKGDGDNDRVPLPRELERAILERQPRSGDYLLLLVADRRNKLHRRAVNAFFHTWESMTGEQIKAYIRHHMVLKAFARQRYPQGVDAFIEFRYYCYPTGVKFKIATRTSHFLDGRRYGKPYSYPGPVACTGWLATKDLALGKHSLTLTHEYEFTHKEKKYTGRIDSPKFTFSMLKNPPDDLVAAKDDATDRLVRQSLRFAERESQFDPQPAGLKNFDRLGVRERRPQITWEGPGGQTAGLASVCWKVAKPLPVDLSFAVTLHDQKTGKVYRCLPIVLRRGKECLGYIAPDDVRAFARGRVGEVPVKLVLTRMTLTPSSGRLEAPSARTANAKTPARCLFCRLGRISSCHRAFLA